MASSKNHELPASGSELKQLDQVADDGGETEALEQQRTLKWEEYQKLANKPETSQKK